ncbi:TetR family transcriptional regulator C-terminal domain-containing protein [Falsiruegeria mediterranea]|uniref:HTH-type transcriptional regulator BetI n=1 Tax=Falsiruegeria mediterranea M17 TaxID=1200281 RepID=A0A2R8CDY6_9RHOB|nr:TetR family transcriptional regulator C-terminal domain-containing protein [Falsiruegeria mediterranea]SPJ30615.1 HTH-type transcriptional regulator BetI [Falsiruegeria mediterranea M17]
MAQAEQKRPRKERKENADRRRRQLLDAACRSILVHGLAKTTLATVASEADLSQGVAAFYFKSKAGLLTEALRDLYQRYEDHWTKALDQAGVEPAERLRALIRADFHPDACGAMVLPLWYAFWGELRSQQEYDEVAGHFEARRRETLCAIWQDLLAGQGTLSAVQMAEWMETLTDGYWQRLHLAPDSLSPEEAERAAWACLVRLAPDLLDHDA